MIAIDVLRTDGRVEHHDIDPDDAFGAIERLIGAGVLDIVNLRNGRVMFVDDVGAVDAPGTTAPAKPVNAAATALYLGICRPGTTHQIHGDVAVARDADFDTGDD
jgi:hypothetical protein